MSSPAATVPTADGVAAASGALLVWRKGASGVQIAELVTDELRFKAWHRPDYVEADAAIRVGGRWWTQERLWKKIATPKDREACAQAWLDDALAMLEPPAAPQARSQVWLLTRYANGRWSFDGAHGVDDDLGNTYAIYRRAFPDIIQYLKLTLKPDKHGTMWPTVEDVTDEVRGCTVPLPDGGILADMVAGRIGHEEAIAFFKSEVAA